MNNPFSEYKVDNKSGCWNWKGSINGRGYGQFHQHGIKHWAHRYFYEAEYGPIPDGLHIDHLCRNRACVNPKHLEAVTPLENNHRGKNVKLSAAKAANIQILSRIGLKQKTIAILFGVSGSSIGMVLTGRTWPA